MLGVKFMRILFLSFVGLIFYTSVANAGTKICDGGGRISYSADGGYIFIKNISPQKSLAGAVVVTLYYKCKGCGSRGIHFGNIYMRRNTTTEQYLKSSNSWFSDISCRKQY